MIILTDADPTPRPDPLNMVTITAMLPAIQRQFDQQARFFTEMKIAALRKSCGVEDTRRWTGPTIRPNYTYVPVKP